MSLAPALDLRPSPDASPLHAPANVEAEQALLGVLLYDNRAFESLGDFLRPAHFFEPFHGRLFEAIETATQRGRLADPTLLASIFDGDAVFIEAGGVSYLADLVDRSPPSAAAKDYARTVYDLALRRELIRVGGEIAHSAETDTETEPATLVEVAEQSLFALAEQRSGQTGFQVVDHYVDRAIEMASEAFSRDGGLSGVATGLTDLDRMLGGLHKTDLVILGARPSMGKTSILVNIARHAAQRGVPTAVFSLEMSGEQLSLRLLSDLSDIPGDRVRRGVIDSSEFGRLRDAGDRLRGLPLYIDDQGANSIGRLTTRSRRLKRLHGLGLIVIDYLQLITAGQGSRPENRVQEVSQITQGLKALAKDLEVPVIAAAQLSREVEKREDKRPQLSDLRESGSIEQDADVVMFLYREAYYLGRTEPLSGSPEHLVWEERMSEIGSVAEIIIGKQRHGPIGTVRLHFNEALTRFSDLASEDRYAQRRPYKDD